MSIEPPTDDELHAYVDAQLSPERAAVVEAFLASSPETAARVSAWRRDAQHLRTAFEALDRGPPGASLDPASVRRRMRMRSIRRLSLAASLVIALGLGGVAGWSARSATLAKALPMQDAVYAYKVFATDQLRPVELSADNAADLQSWLASRLGRTFALADLRPYGFRLLGGRLLSTENGPAGMIIYESAGGERISFYLRPTTRFASGVHGRRIEDGLLASYWFREGYGFALVGRAGDPRTAEIGAVLPAAIL